MNELGMIIDCSHLSDKGFYDCIKYSKHPIVCSHSNSRSVCNVVRNMSDEMILALKENKGLMGINYCPDFISNSKKNQIPDIIKHINHIKSVGGIDIIALGSDFDGIPTPNGMSDCTKVNLLKEALIKEGYTHEEIEKIFYKNFLRVFKKVCK
jgi:membrane dipeptidase